MSFINFDKRENIAIDTRPEGSKANYRSYDSVGLWNPPRVGVRGSESSFGILPQIENASQSGFTLGYGYDLWSLIVKKDANAGSAPKLRTDVRYRYGKDSAASDVSLGLGFDSGKVTMPWFGSFLGSATEARLNVNGEIGRDYVSKTSRFGIPTSSFSCGIRDFLNFGEKNFALFKYVGYTLAYNGNTTISDEKKGDADRSTLNMYGYRASDSWWGKYEAALNVGPDLDFTVYYKESYGNRLHRANVDSQEKYRVGANIGAYATSNLYCSFSAEGYNAPAQYNGDPYQKAFDYDMYAKFGLDRIIESADKKNYVSVNFGIGSTEIKTWVDRGYRPPVSLTLGLTGAYKGWSLEGAFDYIIKPKHKREGIYDKVEYASTTSSHSWQDIPVDWSSGLAQTTKSITINPREFARFGGPAKLEIWEDNPADSDGNKYPGLIYEYNDPETGWRTVNPDPEKDGLAQSLTDKFKIKRVLLVDKQHGKTYTLKENNDINTINNGVYFDGTKKVYEIPAEIYNRDGMFRTEVVIEFEIPDTTIIEPAAQPNAEDNPNPELRINCHFNTRVTYTNNSNVQ